jgi:hypothetical protein
VLSCKAGAQSNVVEYLVHGVPLQKPHMGLQRCGFIACPYCPGEVMRRHRRVHQDRLALLPTGLSYAQVTLTITDVPLGQLQDARALVSATLSRAIEARSVKAAHSSQGLVGRISAAHVTLTWVRRWHPHTHLVLAAQGDAVVAGEALAHVYCDRLRRAGRRVTSETVDVGLAPTPRDLIAYLARPWSREPNHDGSLDGLGLAALGLRGDPVCAQAYRELVQAFARRSLFRGAGVLGAGQTRGDRE